MATTDANGQVFYGPTDPVEPLQGLLNGVSTAVSSKLGAQSQIARIANVAGRAGAVAARSGRPITVADPLIVWRADAEAGSELEVTTDGSTWVRAAGGYRDSWEQRREELSKTSVAGGSTSEVLLAALGPVTIPATGRYLISGGSTVAPAGNAAGSLALSDGTISRTRAYHSQSTTAPISMVTSFARTYNAGQSVGVGLRLTPSGGSAATDHLVKWITIERLS